jgi:hypothetical protein
VAQIKALVIYSLIPKGNHSALIIKEEGNAINNYIYNNLNIDLNELADAYRVHYNIV